MENEQEKNKPNSEVIKEPNMETKDSIKQEDIQSKDEGKKERFERIFSIDNTKNNISVGYEITNMEKMETKDDKDLDSYRVAWVPLEVSSVSIPADTSVGVGRARKENHSSLDDERKEKNEMEKSLETPKVETQSKVDVKEITDNARKEEVARIKEISAIGSKHNCSDMAEKSIGAGDSVAVFRGKVLDHRSITSKNGC